MGTSKAISLSPFLDGSIQARQAVADEVARDYAERRFFCVRDHGIARTLINRTEEQTRAYFALPMASKLSQLAVTGCGYLPSPGLIGMPESSVSPNELFLAHRDSDRNPWPSEPPVFGEAIAAYNAEAENLSLLLMRVLALASALPENHLLEQAGQTESFLKLFSFRPPAQTPGAGGKYRLAEHHDYSAVSLIRGAPHPNGLQVLTAANSWEDAYTEDDDALVILVGEQMTRWSNGNWTPSWHRVSNHRDEYPGDGTRASTCYFFNPGCMADDVEGYLEGRAEYARACAAHLEGATVRRNSWESPARQL